MKQFVVISLLTVLCLCGCEGFRYAATEAQRENAWLHREVCGAAADAAVDENASAELCGLTALAHDQSGAFVLDYGLPEAMLHGQAELDRATQQHPQAAIEGATRTTNPDSSLAGGEFAAVLSQAKADSIRKPDVFEVADGAIDLGIALAGLVGGVYGIRIAGYLKQAREKSKALKEIVEGNELFKQLWPEQADRFKEAQQKQSPPTRLIVSELKTVS